MTPTHAQQMKTIMRDLERFIDKTIKDEVERVNNPPEDQSDTIKPDNEAALEISIPPPTKL